MRHRSRRIRLRRGFTLLELLLVLVILGVLAALVVPRFAGRSEEARLTAAKTDVSAIRNAIDSFEIDEGRYPSNEEGLDLLLGGGGGDRSYLRGDGVPKDPWGNEYVYKNPGSQSADPYDLYSFGPDGREGNDDIGNWTAAE